MVTPNKRAIKANNMSLQALKNTGEKFYTIIRGTTSNGEDKQLTIAFYIFGEESDNKTTLMYEVLVERRCYNGYMETDLQKALDLYNEL